MGYDNEMKRRSIIWFAVAAFAGWPAVHASPQIVTAPAQPALDEPFVIQVEGQWPTSCIPQLGQQRWQDNSLMIFANLPEGPCDSEPTDYAFDVDTVDLIPASAGNTIAVKLMFSEPDSPVSRLHGFGLITRGEVDWQPESGLWWPLSGGQFDTSGPGVALSLEFQQGQLLSFTNVYDDDGASSWVVSSGDLHGASVNGQLNRPSGGQALFDRYRKPQVFETAGELYLQFHSPATATAWLTTAAGASAADGLLLQPISLVRYVFGESYREFVRGRWLIVPEDDPALTRSLEFDGIGEEIDGWLEFPSLDGSAQLRCQLAESTAAPARQCQLQTADTEIIFDQIGLDRLRGASDTGSVIAIRLD